MNEFKVEWDVFKTQMDSFVIKGNELTKISPRNSDDTEKFISEYKSWRSEVVEYLTIAFDKSNSYVQSFRIANSNKYNFPGHQTNFENLLRENKQDLRNDLVYIEYFTKLISISDILTKPNEINISIRETYTSEEILEFILDKLYELYDDNIYPILPILEGNGIVLKKKREEYEYVKILESLGLVISNNIGRQADAQLTVNGKMHVENKRKLTKPNYNAIPNDNEELSLKIDDLKLQLEKLGFGQQVIFEELEDLKNYYTLLNKESWAQLFKGKLIDLGLSQVITGDIMKLMYETIVHDTLRIQ